MTSDWQLASGTILGRRHRVAGRNNQDAFCVTGNESNLVAVVCDGCSSGAHSEVGAQVGARMLAHLLLARVQENGLAEPETLLEEVRCDALIQLGQLAQSMGSHLTATVCDTLLFTVIGAYITPQDAVFFALGDGAVWVNGEAFALGPFPGNAPPYLSYGLVETHFAPEDLGFKIVKHSPTEELKSFLIGTDGVCDLRRALTRPATPENGTVARTTSRTARQRHEPMAGFWQTERFFVNPDSVRRTLANLNRDRAVEVEGEVRHQAGLLPDDTTLIVGRRAPEFQGGER